MDAPAQVAADFSNRGALTFVKGWKRRVAWLLQATVLGLWFPDVAVRPQLGAGGLEVPLVLVDFCLGVALGPTACSSQFVRQQSVVLYLAYTVAYTGGLLCCAGRGICTTTACCAALCAPPPCVRGAAVPHWRLTGQSLSDGHPYITI